MRRPTLYRRCFGVFGLLALLTGCAGEGAPVGSGPPVDGSASFATIQQEIFDRRCTSASCHAAATRSGGLSLVDGQSYADLVNVEPDNAAAKAAGLLRVVPDHPEQSFLMRKVTGDLSSGEGSQMPLGE